MIGFAVLRCPSCGAPLPAEALLSVVACAYCGASVAPGEGHVSAAAFRSALAELDEASRGEPRLWIGDVPYRTLARLATGERYEVWLGERARRITERVVIRLALRDEEPAIERTAALLARLNESDAAGAAHFTLRLPQLVSHGTARSDGGRERPAIVTRYASGFVHTLIDVRRAHPGGVDARHAIWMWRRMLELLGFMHRAGVVHGALEPEHVLVHARDHGATFAGWSSAAPIDRRSGRSSPAADIAASARCIAHVLGGDPKSGVVPSTLAAPIAALVRTLATSDSHDAWRVGEAVEQAGRAAFGPPSYQRLKMPGWR